MLTTHGLPAPAQSLPETLGLEAAARQQRLEEATALVQRLAHDFGNVLTGILGFSELALGQLPAGTSAHTYVEEVYRAAQQGAQLTERLRLFSRRGQPPTRGAAPLAAVAAAEAERLRAAWGPDVCLAVDVAADLPPVAVEAEQLRHLLGPLLDNAREAIAGTGVVTLSARVAELTAAACRDLFGSPTPGLHLEITVADTGCGLSPEARCGILAGPFFSTKPRHRGLGLAVVYGVVTRHQGGLALGPGPDGGTVARVYLPVAGPAGAPKEKVLVVDDDPLVLQMVRATLERDGYRVQAAASAAEALDCFGNPAAGPFRLVLSDVLMPGTTGVDLARQLLGRDAGVRVLFMSGYVSPDFARSQLGGARFPLLQKPFRPDSLLRAVRTALDQPALPAVLAS